MADFVKETLTSNGGPKTLCVTLPSIVEEGVAASLPIALGETDAYASFRTGIIARTSV